MTDAGPVRRPPPLSIGISVAAAVVVALSVARVPIAVGIGVSGVVTVTVGLVLASRPLLEVSGAMLGLAVVAGGALGATPASVSVAALAAVVAFDVADHAQGLGQEIGRDARTRRNELVHAGGSLLVGGVAGAIAYGVFLGIAGGQPTTALAFLLCGAIALVAALR
jgi:hypothetical protein